MSFTPNSHPWVSKGKKPNPKPIGFGGPNSKTTDEKSFPNLNPLDSKPADVRLETGPLPSLNILNKNK